MTITVFVWDMFRGFGVGHASMHVHGDNGSIYVSFWPQIHSLKAGFSSPGHIHFMNGDRKSDGMPQWASKPINDLDEAAIISWWSKIQYDPLINYDHKKPFQLSQDEKSNFQTTDKRYSIIFRQCSTTVVKGLWIGASITLRLKMAVWLAINAGTGLGPIQLPPGPHTRIPTITPKDVKNLVISIWGDI